MITRRVFASIAGVGIAIVLATASPGQAAAHGGHGFSGNTPAGHFEGHHGFDGHRGFEGHHDFRGRRGGFVGVPFYWGPPYVDAYPPAYTYYPPAPAYWYYCPSYGAYYPTVATCPDAWVPVPAQ
jgi:hypothetical protein